MWRENDWNELCLNINSSNICMVELQFLFPRFLVLFHYGLFLFYIKMLSFISLWIYINWLYFCGCTSFKLSFTTINPDCLKGEVGVAASLPRCVFYYVLCGLGKGVRGYVPLGSVPLWLVFLNEGSFPFQVLTSH